MWIAGTRKRGRLDLKTDETGWWTMYNRQDTGVDLGSLSFMKEGWITTKTNVITINDQDNTDFAISISIRITTNSACCRSSKR